MQWKCSVQQELCRPRLGAHDGDQGGQVERHRDAEPGGRPASDRLQQPSRLAELTG